MVRSRRKEISVEPETPLEVYITKMAGPEALLVFRALRDIGDDALEDEIAEKTGFSKNMTRRLLYRLHDLNLVMYRRVRSKDTGWYQYYWRINKDNVTLVMLNIKKDVLNKLRERLSTVETDSGSYKCPRCERKFSFDDALMNEFKCPYCGEELHFIDRSFEIEVLRDYISKLEEELKVERKKIQGG